MWAICIYQSENPLRLMMIAYEAFSCIMKASLQMRILVSSMGVKLDFAKLIPFAVIYACCSVAGMMLIKTAGNTGVVLAGFHLNWKVLLGLAVYFSGFCVYFYFFQKNDVSYVFPLFVGMNYMAVVFSAAFVLKEAERINVYQWFGIAAVLAGILLMNIKPGGK